ncbi:hypothetical protein [Klebsiella grimontii]|uniref:hypothetical protein n=1 Tax=Klebsiella grimontii TaxID=2058152 RepID=UPI0015AE60A2|nr:hypothetical protein [Klebsiella grimontii]
MEDKLIFCSDAIMRFQSDYDKTAAVPLLSISVALYPECDNCDKILLLLCLKLG